MWGAPCAATGGQEAVEPGGWSQSRQEGAAALSPRERGAVLRGPQTPLGQVRTEVTVQWTEALLPASQGHALTAGPRAEPRAHRLAVDG